MDFLFDGTLNVSRRLEQELASIKMMFTVKLGVKNVDIWDYIDAPEIGFEEMRQQYQQE